METTINVPHGPQWPVDPKFTPINGFDTDGNPKTLLLGANGEAVTSSDATAANQQLQLGKLSDLINRAFGLNGATYISGTSATTGTFVAIQALADAVVSTMTSSDLAGTLTNVPIPAGVTIYGTITSITLTSGKVIAYNK